MPGAKALRLLLVPALYLVAVWTLYFRTEDTLSVVPRVWPSGLTKKTYHDLLPPVPGSLLQAFKLGQLERRLETEPAATAELLQEAARVLGRDEPLQPEQMRGMLPRIEELDQEVGVVQRVRGAFTLVNVLWLASIVGIVVTFGPALAAVFGPLVRWALESVIWILQHVIVPFLKAIEPVYELAAYALCFWFVCEGVRHPAEFGFFIGLTGALGTIPAFMYSTALHASGGGDKEVWAQVFNVFLAAGWAPLAVHYQSTLYGFLTVLAVYGALGFSVACYGLCYVVGFHNDKAMERVTASSLLLLVAFVGVKALRVQRLYLEPFSTAVLTMGCITYLLALLIMSSRYYSIQRGSYLRNNGLMVLSLLVIIGLGSVLGLQSLFRIGCTYGVMYFMEKGTEVRPRGSVWVKLLLGFVALYAVSLYLHTHPGFLVSLFDASAFA